MGFRAKVWGGRNTPSPDINQTEPLLPGAESDVASAHPKLSALRSAGLNRLKQKMLGRGVEWNAVFPGTGGALEGPRRAAPPPPVRLASAPEAADPIVASNQNLSAQAQALAERLEKVSENPLWDRPARSKFNKIVTRVVPWLKPNDLGQFATIHKDFNSSKESFEGVPSPAIVASEASVSRSSQAAKEVQAHIERSHAVSLTMLQPIEARLLATQVSANQLEFTQTRVEDLKKQLSETHLAVLDRLTSTPRFTPARQIQHRQVEQLQQLQEKEKSLRHKLKEALEASVEARYYANSPLEPVSIKQLKAALRQTQEQKIAVQNKLRTAKPNLSDPPPPYTQMQDFHLHLNAAFPGSRALQKAEESLSAQMSGSKHAVRCAQTDQQRLGHTALQAMAQRPPGFEANDDDARAFGAQLKIAIENLPHNPAADALSPSAMMEIMSHAVAQQSRSDGTRAQQLLQALQAHPTNHWLAQNTEIDASDEAAEDVRALMRMMSSIPRGSELLHLFGANQGHLPDSTTLQALRTFWSADAAQRKEANDDVRKWLSKAKNVASLMLQKDREADFERLAKVDKGAYNAVRNGYFSNAPGSDYHRHDAQMKKTIDAWLGRAQKQEDYRSWNSWKRHTLHLLTPHRHKTPYKPATLKRLTKIADSLGMTTSRKLADEGIHRLAQGLSDWVDADLRQRLIDTGMKFKEVGPMIAVMQTLLQHIQRSKHPSQLSFKKATALDALRALMKDLMEKIPPEDWPVEKQKLLAEDPELDRAADLVQFRFKSKDDIVKFFEPFVLHGKLRDKLKFSGGGAIGFGLPSIPYGSVSPLVSPVISGGAAQKNEAFLQLFASLIGLEISMGSTQTRSFEGVGGVAVGPKIQGIVKAQFSATQKVGWQKAQTPQGTLMRFFRVRGKDHEMRVKMLDALKNMVHWDDIALQGTQYSGPLEAVFSCCPDVNISSSRQESTTWTSTSRISAGANLKMKGIDGKTYRVGPLAYASFKAERIKEKREDKNGHVHIRFVKGDTAQQKLSVGAQLNTLTPSNDSQINLLRSGKGGAIEGGGMPSLIDLSRDLSWNLEKHMVSPFLIGNKQDADLDRYYSTAKDMLAEISANREAWLHRCLENMEPDKVKGTNTFANRQKAERLLQEFEAQIIELDRTNHFCQYNVNYSMRPKASAWLDALRALESLMVQKGDDDAARQYRTATDEVMRQHSTWRPLMLTVRERSRDTRNNGWNFGPRLQRTAAADGERAAAQYPPI